MDIEKILFALAAVALLMAFVSFLALLAVLRRQRAAEDDARVLRAEKAVLQSQVDALMKVVDGHYPNELQAAMLATRESRGLGV